MTANCEEADESYPNQFDRLLVGTVWMDRNGNGVYDAGEGLGGVTVTTSSGPYYAVTAAGDGDAIPVLAAAQVHVAFLGPSVPARTRTVGVGSQSMLVDYVVPRPR